MQEEEIRAIKLAPCHVEIFDIGKIINSRSKLSVTEKIKHCIKLETALLKKLSTKGKRFYSAIEESPGHKVEFEKGESEILLSERDIVLSEEMKDEESKILKQEDAEKDDDFYKKIMSMVDDKIIDTEATMQEN